MKNIGINNMGTTSPTEILGAVLAGFGFWPRQKTKQKLQSGLAMTNAKDTNERLANNAGHQVVFMPRPLRVIRQLDGNLPSAHAGRMVISGRMADVCAELDRLAA